MGTDGIQLTRKLDSIGFAPHTILRVNVTLVVKNSKFRLRQRHLLQLDEV